MKVAVAADHAGFTMKGILAAQLEELGYEVEDLGTFDQIPSDYPDWARLVGRAVTGGVADRGILICGSGVGACVAANKIKGIRAGLCHDTYSARQGVEHDDINVLCIGARVIGSAIASDIARAFLEAKFSYEDRHVRRVQKVIDIEQLQK
jgi:ribose 5-phosphate isomerase B